ncbi:isorenieratene synthase [Sorangium cellulosum]|uniref:Isorenieratene synthase n=1 Tax=Sorangium cellulosum TaxID=56 RepID=A0A150QM42_SORCE|nr:isorenieratene synthase [Sorangium cellulosum]
MQIRRAGRAPEGLRAWPFSRGGERVTALVPRGLSRVPAPLRAVVVGGGIAGVSAATVLAERGASVTLIEREPVLGGRISAWTEHLPDGTAFQMERGFHAFFRQYYNLRSLLARIHPAGHLLTPLSDYPLLGPGGARESIAGLPHQTPLNVLALLARSRSVRLRDLLRVDFHRGLQMLAFDGERTYRALDGQSARAFLDGLRLPPTARRMLFDVFAHSFFNPEDEMSAAELLAMFHFYFLGNPEGLLFDVLSEPFSVALWEPFERRLEALGARVLVRTEATRVLPGAGGWEVHLGGDRAPLPADAVVLAVTVPALRAIVASSPVIGDAAWRARVDRLAVTRPFVVWRLWLDRPTAPGRHPFAGTAGFGPLENVSLFHLFQNECRRWAERTRGSVVELHAYAVPPGIDEAALRADMLAGMHALCPELSGARVLHERWLWRQDCPAFAPGSSAERPGVETPSPGVVVAGDFVRLPFPAALMERAASSGILAANTLLARSGVESEPLRSVPRRGLLAGMIPGT